MGEGFVVYFYNIQSKQLLNYEFYIFSCCFTDSACFFGVVIALSRAISPRSYNLQKFEAYECGIPTRGKSWMQFRVGYYLFAILFLMFDVETAFLFPWAVVMRDMGPQGHISILFFFIILVLGLAYAWRKGALEWK